MNNISVSGSIPDINPADNIITDSSLVTGSFDPNDKTVSPTGVGANGDIAATETDLTYLIRFQNTCQDLFGNRQENMMMPVSIIKTHFNQH